MKRRTFLTGPGLSFIGVLAVLLGVSRASAPSTSEEVTLSIDNAARSSTPNVQITGLYGGTATGNVLLTNDHDQGYNANAQTPIAASGGTAEVTTGAFQTILPNGKTKDININPTSQFVAGSTSQTAALMSWGGVLEQVSDVNAQGATSIVVNGNLTLNANGTISITNSSGTTVFSQENWNSEANPLRNVLSWNGTGFRLDLGDNTTITINGYNSEGSGAESRGLDIRANLTYEGAGAFGGNVASGMENRGIWGEGESKHPTGGGGVVGRGGAVSILASREGDGLPGC